MARSKQTVRLEDFECDILTVNEVAAFLRTDASSVYRMAQNGVLPPVKVGGRRGGIRFYKPVLLAYVRGSGYTGDIAANVPLTGR